MYGKESQSLKSGNLPFASTRSISAWAFVWTSGFRVIARMNMTIEAPVASAPATAQIERDAQIGSEFTVPARSVIAVCLIITFCLSMSWFSSTASKEDDTKEYSALPLNCHSNQKVGLAEISESNLPCLPLPLRTFGLQTSATTPSTPLLSAGSWHRETIPGYIWAMGRHQRETCLE